MLFCWNTDSALRCLFIAQLSFVAFWAATVQAQQSPQALLGETQSSVDSSNPSISARLIRLQNGTDTSLIAANITLAKAVAQFYTQRQARLVWAAPTLLNTLLLAIESLELDGLNPEDYHLSILRKQQALITEQTANTSKIKADMDLLATDAYFRALYHLYNGKVDSSGTEPQWSFELTNMPVNTVTTLMANNLLSAQIEKIFFDIRPQQAMYKSMRAGLARYRLLADLGGWPKLTIKESLKPGAISPQVAELRKRLAITGELRRPVIYPFLSPMRATESVSNNTSNFLATKNNAQGAQELVRIILGDSHFITPEITTSLPTVTQIKPVAPEITAPPIKVALVNVAPVNPDEIFDDELVAAVKLFQREQYLEADGAVGPATRIALNITAEVRVAQVRVNLDRIRWLLHNLPEHSVLVDVAGFKITYFKSSEPVWRSLVQVGMAIRTTPLINSAINYITLNPTWTVPPTILRDDISPKIQKDLLYLRKHNIRVLDPEGVELDPATINWSRPGNVILRQSAGSDAALGKAVIRFPNNDSIYLHDTPHQELFVKSQRAFSSGCIRVERALELVSMLLADTPGWDDSAIERALATGETRNVTLAKKIPVILAYWTVDTISENHIAFKPDIYDRDRTFLEALNKPMLK